MVTKHQCRCANKSCSQPELSVKPVSKTKSIQMRLQGLALLAGARPFFHWVWGFLFAYISLIPFYYLQPVQFTIDSSTVTATKYLPVLLVGYLTLLTLWFCHTDVLPVLRTFSFSLIFFLNFYLVICLFSVVINASFVGIGILKFSYYTVTGIFLFFLMVCQLTQNQLLYRQIRWIVLIASVVALYGTTVYISGQDYLWGKIYEAYDPYYSGTSRIASTLGNPNCVGSYLALCLPCSLWVFCAAVSSSWKQRFIYGTCLGIIITGLWLTFSRGAWIAAGITCGIYLYPRLGSIVRSFKRPPCIQRLVVGFVFLLLLIPVAEVIGVQGLMCRAWNQTWMIGERTLNLTKTEPFRLAQYRTTWHVLQEHPLLGVGFGNFTRLFEKYKHPSTPAAVAGTTAVTTTDNMYLMVACETGILGLISFLGFLFALAQTLYRRYRTAPSGPDRDLYLAALAAFCGFLVNMITWDALNQPTVRMTFWMLMGIVLSQGYLMRHDCGDNGQKVAAMCNSRSDPG